MDEAFFEASLSTDTMQKFEPCFYIDSFFYVSCIADRFMDTK